MSSFTRRRPDRWRWRAAAALAAAVVATGAGALGGRGAAGEAGAAGATGAAGAAGAAGATGAAPVLAVLAVQPAGDDVTLVAGVTPAPASPLSSGAFRIDAGGATVAGTTEPVMSGKLATALVLDTSDAGAAELQGGVNGAASFVLQLSDGARTLVVADGGRPAVLAPLTPGAATAIAALNRVRATGDRQTGAALQVAVDGLPPAPGRPRLLVLYTGAPDAGGEPAAELARRLRRSGVLLAVAATAADHRYWSQVAEDTGGVLVSAAGPGTLRAFDQLAGLLRSRYVVTFPRPAALPATVRLSVQVEGGTASTTAVLPADVAATGPPSRPGGPASGTAVGWGLLLVVLVAAAAGLALSVRRRAAAPVPALSVPSVEPVRQPGIPGRAGGATPAGPPRPAPDADLAPPVPGGHGRDQERPAAPAPTGGTAPPLPSRTPGASPPPEPPRRAPLPPGPPAAAEPADAAGPVGAAEPAEAAEPVAAAEPTPAAEPADAAEPAEAADERAYERLDAEVGRAAADVAHGCLDTPHAVARIAFAARGRLDLLDRVIATERLLSGAELGPSPPAAAVLELLTAARRIVAGEVALVGPAGVRVKQRTRIDPDGRPRHVLQVSSRDRLVRECRTTGELARHVDLASLTPDSAG